MRTLKEQIEDRCVHFNGVQHDRCEAGIEYKSFPKGVFPCLKHHCQPGPCPKLQWPTADEVAKEIAEIEAENQKFLKVMPLISKIKRDHKGHNWRGDDICPVCGSKIVLSHSSYNGHVWGKCSKEGCLSWME